MSTPEQKARHAEMVQAANDLMESNQQLAASVMRLTTHISNLSDKVYEHERKILALEGLAGIGDLQ